MKPLVNKKYIIDCVDYQGEAICTSDNILDNDTGLPTYFMFEFPISEESTSRTVVVEEEVISEVNTEILDSNS
jgi:hypothetical protein